MATIGGVSCSIVRGHPRPQSERIETFEVPGIDGVGVHLFGRGGGEWEAEAVFYGAGANVDAWYLAIAALPGTLVDFQNSQGTTAAGVLVLAVGPLEKRIAEGEGGCRGAVRIALQSME